MVTYLEMHNMDEAALKAEEQKAWGELRTALAEALRCERTIADARDILWQRECMKPRRRRKSTA